MGFRTLAIEQRSAEVWQLLGNVKNEFAGFATLLDKTRQRLKQAADSIDSAARKTTGIQRRLNAVESAGEMHLEEPEELPDPDDPEMITQEEI